MMLKGCYYRCPLAVEEEDAEHPRLFILAQCIQFDEVADVIQVKLHDLHGSLFYYRDLIKTTVYRAERVAHCEAIPGAEVQFEKRSGKGTIKAKTGSSKTVDAPFWYWIEFEDGHIESICETELKLDYAQMNYPPIKQLLSYEFQHPTWFLNHLKVSRNQHITNNSIYGFPILAGCRAYMMSHQVSTVVRCFESMPIRYMLADEVGLGKTIEACSILSILQSRNDSFRTLIIVPAALVMQWQNELHYKYNISSQINSIRAKTCLVPLEELNRNVMVLGMKWDMVILDETHRLLRDKTAYDLVQRLSESVEHILLLSATPIQDRNEEYHSLLSLLNPEQYKDMTEERFAWLVKKQKKIQSTVNQQLNRLARYSEYKEDILSNLCTIAETLEDKSLTKLLKKVDITSEDEGLEAERQVLAYICENYRVERNVIRNRRQMIKEKLAKRTLIPLSYKPGTIDDGYNEISAIQGVVQYLTEHNDESDAYVEGVMIPLLSALFSSPWALAAKLNELQIQDSLLQSSVDEWLNQATNEHRSAVMFLTSDPDLIKGRLLKALNYIDQETDILSDEKCKLVVFTAFPETLNEFVSIFNTYFRSSGIRAVRFAKGMSRSDLEDSVYDFQNDPQCRVIVCDETGGEGRNFQLAEQVIHLDLPWNANAVEQRIGRLDRLGRDDSKDVVSVVFYAEDSIEEQLFEVWRDGLMVFEQSLSGLEIITGELNRMIVEAIAEDPQNGLRNALDNIKDEAEDMRDSVEDEQLFDLGLTLYRPMNQGVENLLSVYAKEDDNLFAKAMLGWGSQAGLIPTKKEDGLVEFNEVNFSVNAAKQCLFIPPFWQFYHDAAIVRRRGHILGTFDRKTAALREDILFYAPGDPVYDSIINNAIGCSRGRCAAIGTVSDFKYDGLVFFYNVELNLDPLLEAGIGLETLAQFKMYLPLNQIVVPLGLTDSSRQIPESKVIQTIQNLRAVNADHMGRRSSGRLVASPLERFMTQFPPEKWEKIVINCYKASLQYASAKLKEEADFSDAKKEMHRIVNGYRAECLYYDRDISRADEKDRAFEATYNTLKTAKPVLDAVCYLRVRSNAK